MVIKLTRFSPYDPLRHETQMTNLLPSSMRLDSTYGAHPTSSLSFYFCRVSQNHSYISGLFLHVNSHSIMSMSINEEKQSQQTENEEFLVLIFCLCGFLVGF